ncbi:MAG: glutathione S-transferase family protein [Rhodospirillaceae bacterium]|jgi:glutathione S-transferase|nr:glutathione S-transferase family protein [Rhodospirillaceae bacterium]MBT5242267.1 glutathione S-transferase family protein [Rhodospirillaceae bacterium]MBT5565995.1 glutathione S-transferase family protein [Rhodospirillaceae bacterium]MBT6088585.1 glutathione S-transferase family protein [Rhodospirillaceae bacterium]MBT6960445.1 glutathione S-transferase family protein [Rhodospirillaceae bacterium]
MTSDVTKGLHLYGQMMSPYVARVTLTAYRLGLDLRPEPVPGGGTASPEFRAINPIGRVPALVHGDLWLAEGEVICSYLRDLIPDQDVDRTDPAIAARGRLVARIVDLYLMGHYVPLIPLRRQDNPDQAFIETKVTAFKDGLSVLETVLSPGPFALGSELGHADCALGPAIDYLSIMMPHFGIADLTDGYPKLKAWWSYIRDKQPFASIFAEGRADLRAYREEHGLAPLDGL